MKSRLHPKRSVERNCTTVKSWGQYLTAPANAHSFANAPHATNQTSNQSTHKQAPIRCHLKPFLPFPSQTHSILHTRKARRQTCTRVLEQATAANTSVSPGTDCKSQPAAAAAAETGAAETGASFCFSGRRINRKSGIHGTNGPSSHCISGIGWMEATSPAQPRYGPRFCGTTNNTLKFKVRCLPGASLRHHN